MHFVWIFFFSWGSLCKECWRKRGRKLPGSLGWRHQHARRTQQEYDCWWRASGHSHSAGGPTVPKGVENGSLYSSFWILGKEKPKKLLKPYKERWDHLIPGLTLGWEEVHQTSPFDLGWIVRWKMSWLNGSAASILILRVQFRCQITRSSNWKPFSVDQLRHRRGMGWVSHAWRLTKAMGSCKIEKMFDVFWGLKFFTNRSDPFFVTTWQFQNCNICFNIPFVFERYHLSPDLRFCPVVRKKSTHPYVLVYSVYRILMCIHLYNNME